MYSVSVREHMMIAHSLKGEIFGPAQDLHGATYTADVEFRSPDLDENRIVLDIGLASQVVKEVTAKLNFKNLDELEEFRDELTTTEVLAKYIHDEVQRRVLDRFSGSIKVTLHESHVAWASYEGESLG
jgi:6-pyruvoyltetrahydropterin/6-carboxytetrahydropterin synthase